MKWATAHKTERCRPLHELDASTKVCNHVTGTLTSAHDPQTTIDSQYCVDR